MSPSKILFFLCISFIAGIFLEFVANIPQIFVWGILILVVAIIFVFSVLEIVCFLARAKKHTIMVFLGFCVLTFVLGILRVQISEFKIANNKLSKLNDNGEITLTGVVSEEPDIRDTSQKLNVRVSVQGEDSIILVTTKKYPEYNYLEKVKITGKLETPMETEDFSYKNYLLKDHIYSVMGFPKVELLLEKRQYNVFSYLYEKILFAKGKIRQSVQASFLPPQSSILQGIILGDKSAISQGIKDKFRMTGLSHIIAVSGMHVVILSSIVMSFLIYLGLWRRWAFWGSATFIIVYIVLTGLPSSAVRAGIMGIIYLAGQALGRQTMSLRIITLAGASMLLFNPLLLFYDIGFQLSFLAVLGLIYLEPGIRNFIKFLADKFLKVKIKEKFENALMIFTVTMAAQIFTLPIIIYNFGRFSLVSPLTNVLIMPVIYYVIFFGFLSSLAGVLWGVFGWVLSVPCYFLMTYFLWVIDIFAKPWAYKEISGVSWVWVLFSYLIIIFATWFLNKKFTRDFI